MSLSERERITLLMMRGWSDNVRPFAEVTHLFNATFPDRAPISKSTAQYTVARFVDTGSVKDRARSGRPSTVTDEDGSLDILQSFIENPNESVTSAAQSHGLGGESVRKLLKMSGFKVYRVTLLQELSEDDFDRRMEFSEIMMNKIDQNKILLDGIVFSDESTFMWNGHVNRHNCRYWDNVNPHWMSECHTQHPPKLNVWAAIVRNSIIGPFFIDVNFNAKYKDMLQNEIALQATLGADFQTFFFQQDGAPPHYSVQVKQYLDAVFPHRWIGRRDAIEWPARSPDLTPLDYFLWGYIKDKVNRTQPTDLNELRHRISHEAQAIPREYIQNAVASFYNRLAHCQTTDDEHFQHLL
uniref:DUF4817 domain-containing protein n=1 Tax=Graphocephala atropunctata TaxID=36148 RepID=A0A1B6KCB5_9HEMI